MDHKKIKTESIVERYLLNKLPRREARRFEEHFFGCDQCFNEVKAMERIVFGLKNAAAKGLLIPSQPPESELSWLEWLQSRLSMPAISFATTVLVLALLYPAWQGVVTVSRLNEEIQELRQRQTNVAGHTLGGTTRSHLQNLSIKSADEIVVLNFSLTAKEAISYRGEMLDQNGITVWRAENLKGRGEFKTFSLAFHRSFFQEGNYELRIYALDAQGRITGEAGVFPFQIRIN